MADVTPLPEKKPVVNIQKEFRPISLTPCISKVAEEFVVDGFVKPAVMKILNDNQYGAIPNSSTIMLLISMLYSCSLGTHGNGATVRTLLFDYRKAFDLIDHSILLRKLRNQCKLPASINNWIIDFLSDRSQWIEFASECFYEWGPVSTGIPQGTKLGPWLFVLMISDLDTNTQQWKYVDNTMVFEVVVKGGESHAQAIANRVIECSRENRVQLNADKCKELRISSAKEQRVFYPVIIEGKEVELVTCTKLLGLTITNDLTWYDHVTEITKKASKKLYLLTQLKRAGVPKQDLALFYVLRVRSVIDYAAPVFFNGLPQYLKKELVRLEKRVISILTSGKCNSAIEVGLTLILEQYYVLCSRLFDNIVSDPNHKLKALFPPDHDNLRYNQRRERLFNMPRLCTNRTSDTFIYAMSKQSRL